jgi:hypothetical protein
VLEGVLVRPAGATKTAVAGLGDAVNGNDKALMAGFPYVALPHAGSDPRVGQNPVQFRQSFTGVGGRITARASGITPAAKGGTAELIVVMGNGSLNKIATVKLDASGTATPSVTIHRLRVGTSLTAYWRIIPARGSAAGINTGVPTTVTVR